MPLPIEEILTELVDDEKPIVNAWLVDLSHLTPEEIVLLEKTWPQIESERRRCIINLMVEMAEENPKLDYDSIFRSRLDDQDDEVRSKAIEGLWESEDSSLINVFIDILEHDRSEIVQEAAAQTMGQFALMAELDQLPVDYKSRLGQALLNIFNDETRSVEVRRRALESLSPLSLPETNPAIDRAYYSGIPKMKNSAVYAMGRTCDPTWLDILLEETGSNETEIRYEVAQACGEIGGIEAVPALAELVDDSDIEVQMATIRAMGKIGGAEAKEFLEKCLDDDNDAIAEAAQKALDELTSDEDPFSLRF